MNTPTTVTADFIVEGKAYQTWYKVFGNLKSTNRTPLVLLHGGPGFCHDYMLPNSKLFNEYRIPLVFYDQLGTGQSTNITNAPAAFWSPELFKNELENLLRHLGISGNFDLLGHSWGGMLAADFAASRQPTGLRKLILANCPSSMKLTSEGINIHMQDFPPVMIEMFQKHEANGTIESPEYKEGKRVFNQKHICILDPWPQELITSFAAREVNPSVQDAMLGGHLLEITGNLKDWDVGPILHRILYPTLLMHSPTDKVHDIAFAAFFERIPKVKWVEFFHSSHIPHFEEPERYFKVVTNFLLQ